MQNANDLKAVFALHPVKNDVFFHFQTAQSMVNFFVSFANLESYLLVLPPSVTPVSMRMFELLHYGVQNKDAGLAMVLILVSIVATYVLCRRGRDGGLL